QNLGTMARLGVWRSLVARSVRGAAVPRSNLGTPIEAPLAGAVLTTRGFPARPSALRAVNAGRRSVVDLPWGRAARRRLRRPFHARPAGARPGARGLPRAGPPAWARA